MTLILSESTLFDDIPAPAGRNIALRVSPAGERALRQGHPWLFDQTITEQSHAGKPGDLAVVFDHQRRFLAVGLYDPGSSIRVRVLQRGKPAAIDAAWFRDRLSAAYELRAPLRAWPADRVTDGFRLVHGENDGLPGLVIDRYADTLVMKLYTAAWLPHLKAVFNALAEVIPAERLILRLSRSLLKQPEALYGLSDGMLLAGTPLDGAVLFRENGLIFESDPIVGQKTGFFLDQRDNRARVEKLSAGKSVLNIFAYTGGFSVYAVRGGAREVVSVDISLPALEAAKRNMAHNWPVLAVQHEIIAEDAFEVLAQMATDGRRFDVVILDPPMFAQSQSQVAGALSAYRKLTQLGLGVLQRGGVLVQASCSSRVDEKTFFELVHAAAKAAGRPLRENERSTHALDHPIKYPEGAYLKCLFATAP